MKHLLLAVRILVWSLCVVCVLAPLACSDDSSEQTSHTGRVQLVLRGSSASGIQYRLRYGTFAISGSSAASLSTEDNLQAEAITVELTAGAYSITLNPGWSLEAAGQDGSFTGVEAALISANPQHC